MKTLIRKKRLSILAVFLLLTCLVATLSGHDPVQAVGPAAGLERHQKAGLTCESCHKEAPPKDLVKGEKCLTCHGDLQKLITKSAKAVPNPHASPHLAPGEQPRCEECHHIHKPSEVSCLTCHQDFKYKMR